MDRYSRMMLWSLVLLLPITAFVGCVPQDRYDQLLTTNRSLQEQLVAMENERESDKASIERLRSQLNRATSNLNELETQNRRLTQQLDEMGIDYDDLLRRVSGLEIGPLPAEVEDAIADLANRYPDVLTFDARRGLLRFASDFTFDLGSAALQSEAQQTLNALAEILNTSAAAGFEARIIGHTDNVPIRRAETRQNHPTNVHLSVHRAISVRDALEQSGVDAVRMQVAGYGEHRPRVPNRSGGTPENRRVEIFLVPMPGDIGPGEGGGARSSGEPEKGPAQRSPEPMK